MDKSVLLVLLCLQVFLLITAFTSTDAAAVVRDDQLPPDQVERRNGNRHKENSLGGSYPGGTILAHPLEERRNGRRNSEYYKCGCYATSCRQDGLLGPPGPPAPPGPRYHPPPPPPPRRPEARF